MLTIHHLNNSRSQRVLWLLEELGVTYQVRRYERRKDMTAPPELEAIHPLGKSPVLTDGGLTLAETGAIVEYILARYGAGRLMPQAGTDDYWAARHFLHYAEGSAMPPLFLTLVLQMIPGRAPFYAKPFLSASMKKVDAMLVRPQIERHLDHWEGAIGASGWFAGPEDQRRRHHDELSRRGGGPALRLTPTGRSCVTSCSASTPGRPIAKA